MSLEETAFVRLMKHPVKYRWFLFSKLPSAFFSGVKVKHIDEKKCITVVPYKWFSKNPFHSTYFACLSMAAEMSTGALSMLHLYKRNPPVSMLVVKIESEFFKKAKGVTIFTCESGEEIRLIIEKAIETGIAQAIKVSSIGRNEEGEKVAEFFITWSFKAKTKNIDQK